jgi:hypothetical protein
MTWGTTSTKRLVQGAIFRNFGCFVVSVFQSGSLCHQFVPSISMLPGGAKIVHFVW